MKLFLRLTLAVILGASALSNQACRKSPPEYDQAIEDFIGMTDIRIQSFRMTMQRGDPVMWRSDVKNHIASFEEYLDKSKALKASSNVAASYKHRLNELDKKVEREKWNAEFSIKN